MIKLTNEYMHAYDAWTTDRDDGGYNLLRLEEGVTHAKKALAEDTPNPSPIFFRFRFFNSFGCGPLPNPVICSLSFLFCATVCSFGGAGNSVGSGLFSIRAFNT
jgi:hypothetical protein